MSGKIPWPSIRLFDSLTGREWGDVRIVSMHATYPHGLELQVRQIGGEWQPFMVLSIIGDFLRYAIYPNQEPPVHASKTTSTTTD